METTNITNLCHELWTECQANAEHLHQKTGDGLAPVSCFVFCCLCRSADYCSSCSTPFVGADFESLASPQAAKLALSVAPPLPTEPASLGFGGGYPCPRAGQHRRVRERAAAQPTPELTGAAAARPGAPGWPGPAWPGRTGSGCCSWCRPSSRRPRRCRGWWTRRPECSPA